VEDQTFDDADEAILATAVRLFAELGYDATTTQMIAAAAGPDGSGSRLLRSGKPRIYRAVLERFRQLEQAAFDEAARTATPDLDGIHHLVDAAVDFSRAHPELISVWIHRGLNDARDIGFPRKVTPVLNTVLAEGEWKGIRQDVDLGFLSWTIVWTITGFARLGSDDPADLHWFRTQLHELVDARLRP